MVLMAAGISTLNALVHTMGSALGRDFLKKSLKLKPETIALTRISMAVGLLISVVLTWLSSKLDVSLAIIAIGTSLFFGLCAAAFLPTYIAALYIKKFPRKAALSSIIAGSACSLIWLFFIRKKRREPSDLQTAFQHNVHCEGDGASDPVNGRRHHRRPSAVDNRGAYSVGHNRKREGTPGSPCAQRSGVSPFPT